MGSPSFGLPTSNNNAPMPIPGNTNPTGTNTGVGFGGASFPNYPVFGAPQQSPVSPMANVGTFSPSNFQGLNTGLATSLTSQPGNPGDHLYKELVSSYGKGMGDVLFQQLTSGLFNPQVASSFLNAMQPGIARGESSILNAFGAEGSRFGSAAALGLGDYQSQVNLNEQQTLASLYENAMSQQLSLESGILPTLHSEQANKGSWMDSLIGGLEIAGGIIGAPFTGGLSLAAIGPGLSEFNKGLGGGSSGGGGGMVPTPSFGMGGMGGFNNTGTFGVNAPSWQNNSTPGMNSQYQDWLNWQQSSSAGSALGGSSGGSTDPNLFY